MIEQTCALDVFVDDMPRSPVMPWNSRRFRRTWRCSWCRRPATRAFKLPGDLPTYFHAACEDCWRREHRHALPATRLTPANRRLRWTIRCQCGQPAHYLSIDWRGLLTGRCRECWARQRESGGWFRRFQARRTLVRRNVPYGDLQIQLLKWVRDTEQARASRTWRQSPDPWRPPTGGGTPLPVEVPA